MCKKYNGWANYPTWNMNIWLNNDEYTQERCVEMANEADSVGELADSLKEFGEELFLLADDCSETPITGVNADLLTWAQGMIDWDEIAKNYWQDRETVASDDDETDDE